MESLYVKLYDKYNKVKKKKFSELDEINKDQELKFLNYVTVAEELIEYLRGENDKLHAQVNNLRSEVDMIRSTNKEKCLEYQKLLMEENQKNKAPSEEVQRLQKLHQEGISFSKDDRNDNMELNAPEGAQNMSRNLSGGSSKRMTRKRGRELETEREGTVMRSCSGQDAAIAGESMEDLSKKRLFSGAVVFDQLPECCKRTIDKSGGDINDNVPANCLFQALVEYLVGMKVSAFNQTEGISISALHQSSGYSFSLTWVENAAGKESELLYRVLSLGTFERVAPEWMREALMFSMNMCPVFFDRIARVIKLHR